MNLDAANSLAPPDVYPVTGVSYQEFTWLLRDCPPEAPKTFDYNALNVNEYAALTALHARGDNKYPSYKTLAANIKASDSTAKRAIKSLQSKGWIVLAEKGCHVCQSSNRYEIRGVPPGVRETLAEMYSHHDEMPEWFDRWCQSDTSPSVTGIPALVSVRHKPWCQSDTQRVKDTRGKPKSNNQEKNPDFEGEESLAGVRETLEDEHISPSGNAASLPVPENVKEDIPSLDTEPSPFAGDLGLPQESNSTGVTETPASRKVTPYSRQRKFSEKQYYRNDRTRKVAPGPIENLPAAWNDDDISEFWLTDAELQAEVTSKGRLHQEGN